MSFLVFMSVGHTGRCCLDLDGEYTKIRGRVHRCSTRVQGTATTSLDGKLLPVRMRKSNNSCGQHGVWAQNRNKHYPVRVGMGAQTARGTVKTHEHQELCSATSNNEGKRSNNSLLTSRKETSRKGGGDAKAPRTTHHCAVDGRSVSLYLVTMVESNRAPSA
jgi:hypothetical protein